MRTLKKILVLVAKTVDNIAGLYDKVKIDNETKKVKKKALKVLLYSLITLLVTFSIDVLSTLLLKTFQNSVINLGIDPYDNIFDRSLDFIAFTSILSIIVSSLVVIGNKRCGNCFPKTRRDDNWSTNPSNPASASYQLMHRHK